MSSLLDKIEAQVGEDEDEDDDFVPQPTSDDEKEEKERKKAQEEEKEKEKEAKSSASAFDPAAFFAQMNAKSKVPKEAPKEKTVIKKEVYDFAGERVVVEKAVKVTEPVNDKPKEKETNQKDTPAQKQKVNLDALKQMFAHKEPTVVEEPQPEQSKPEKRPGSLLDDILNPKKRKMTTLDKTKLDWSSFKTNEGKGIADDLERQAKSSTSYLGKLAFMNRTEDRLNERERAMREAARK